jgi:protein-tyrosine phosphatase
MDSTSDFASSYTSTQPRRQPFTIPKRIVVPDPETACFRISNTSVIPHHVLKILRKRQITDTSLKATPIVGRTIFLGDAEDAKNIAGLKSEGITHIINCCPELQDSIPTVEGIKYMKICLKDNIGEKINCHFDDVYFFIEEALKTNENAKILVHCAAGISRSASFVISFLMRYFSIDFDTAIAAVSDLRENICPNISFILQLKDLEKTLIIRQEDEIYK